MNQATVKVYLDWLHSSLSYPLAWKYASDIFLVEGQWPGIPEFYPDTEKEEIYDQFCIKMPDEILYPKGQNSTQLIDSWAWSIACDQIVELVKLSAAALIEYDNADQYLSMTASEIGVWARLADDKCPPAMMLRPMVLANEYLKNMGQAGYPIPEYTGDE